MKYQYTFSILRYFHDVVGGEFVNVGLLFHCPEARYVTLKYDRRYSRVSNFFGDSAGAELPAMIHRMAIRVKARAHALFPQQDALVVASDVIAPDSSSLQFSAVRGGFCNDAQAKAEQLFDRYVTQYMKKTERLSRTDEEVLIPFTAALRHVGRADLPERVVTSKDFTHKFPISWKNGEWHTGEPLSMDLITPDAIVAKANKWLGQAVNLAEENADLTIHFLIGAPQSDDRRVKDAYRHAVRIIEKAPIEKEIYTEDDAEKFANRVARDLAAH